MSFPGSRLWAARVFGFRSRTRRDTRFRSGVVFGPEPLEGRALLAIVTVQVIDDAFSPASVSIHPGDTVHWVWIGSDHSTTSVAGSVETWNSTVHAAGFTFDHTFTHLGTFAYFCTVHGFDNGHGVASGMSGMVTVTAAASGPSSSSFVIQNDDNVYTRMLDASGNPTGGYYLPKFGQVLDLAVTRFGTGLAAGFEAFVVGTDGQVYAQTIDPGNHQRGYFSTATGAVSSIAAGTAADGNPLLFVVSSAADNNQLYELKLDASGNPTSGGYTKAAFGNLKSAILTHDSAGNPLLFALSSDADKNQVYELKMNASGTPSGGLIKVSFGGVKELAVGHDASNVPEVFVVGQDDSVNLHKFDGTGTPLGGYLGFGGPLKSISVASDASNNPEVFGIGSDGNVYGHKFTAAGDPTAGFFKVSTAGLPGGAKSTFAGVGANGGPELFVVSMTDNQVYAAPFSAAGDVAGPFTLTAAGATKKVVIV